MLNPQSMLIDALRLSPAERIELVEAIWDSLAEVPEAIELTEAQRAELIARFEDFRRNPSDGAPWDEVKQRILKTL